ncbi:MAG TPA: TonB-dependent receptor [Thermoanaerobaculia bacterium]|nr:TonB-dependent receptor [Thermoanaerobaculia bacterium]
MPRLGRVVWFLFLATLPLAAHAASISGRVTLPDGSALPGVTVSADALGVTAVTDADGRYTLELPSGNHGSVRVSAMLAGFQTKTATVDAGSGSATQNFELHVSFGQEITVGSRAIGAEQEKAVPVDVISQEQIVTAPSTETSQIIQKIAPSFNFPRPTITDGTDTVRPATLRGLGPDQLLVMVNSKRRHASALVNANNSVGRGSSGVDLNAIPASAIENIEILRDGAAAQYGSDAIAGVINLVLKSDAQPMKLDAKVGATTHGDGQMIDTSLSGGWKLGPGAIFAVAEYRDRYETNRAAPDPRDQIKAGDAGHNTVAQPNHHWGDSYARDLMFFTNINLPLTKDGKQLFYAFGGYSNRHGSHGGFFRRALQAQNIPSIYPEGFLPLIQPRVTDNSLTGGVRGTFASWFYDLSAGYGRNTFDFFVTDSLNTSLGPTNNQTRFYAGTLGDRLFSTNLDISKQYKIASLAGPLNVAAGLEYRTEGYRIDAGEPNSYIDGGKPDQFGNRAPAGAQVFPGFRPSNEVNVGRNSKAIYVDVEGDVLAKLRLGVAGRFEDYSDFGTTSNGKVTARFSPMDKLILRGSASTGFRAPSLNQSYFSAVSTNFLRDPATGQLAPFEVGTYPVSSPIAKALGAEPLKPETSRNYSAGVVFEPLANLEFTADYFHIDIEDRIVFSGNFTGAKVLPLIQPFGVTGARFFTNAVDTETRGYDLVANHQRSLGRFGRLDLSAAYSNNETKIVGEVATPAQLAGLSEVLFDRIERRRVECGQPKDNIRLMQNLSSGALSTTLRESRYGEFCSFTLLPQDDQTYGATWLTDLEVSYRWRQYTLAVGGENLFDAMPDKNFPGTPQGNFGIFTYPSQSPFGMNGRFIYTRLSYTF